ncbi:MAG TPA: hypothetical protein VJY35_12535 [Candidatus Eisenbacteria bacterium]|nr:hypothetical protein [Candidatus Eisenbacteria bacterium]
MRHESWIVKMSRRGLALLLALTTVAVPLRVTAAYAQAVDSEQAPVVIMEGDAGPSNEMNRWWGAAGAILCAAEIRVIRVAPAFGMNPYLIAAGLAGCLLAAMDMMSTQ